MGFLSLGLRFECLFICVFDLLWLGFDFGMLAVEFVRCLDLLLGLVTLVSFLFIFLIGLSDVFCGCLFAAFGVGSAVLDVLLSCFVCMILCCFEIHCASGFSAWVCQVVFGVLL